MRAWILAAVAAMAVGQAEAAVVSFDSGVLNLTGGCRDEFRGGQSCLEGADPLVLHPATATWNAKFSFNPDALNFVGGFANVTYSAGLRLVSIGFNGSTYTDRDDFYIREASFVVDEALNASQWLISLEYSRSFYSLWYFDAQPNGHTFAQRWSGVDMDLWYKFDNFNTAVENPPPPPPNPDQPSPVPIPATAPLLGAALIGLGFRRRA